MDLSHRHAKTSGGMDFLELMEQQTDYLQQSCKSLSQMEILQLQVVVLEVLRTILWIQMQVCKNVTFTVEYNLIYTLKSLIHTTEEET
jgi:hypothetical protein